MWCVKQMKKKGDDDTYAMEDLSQCRSRGPAAAPWGDVKCHPLLCEREYGSERDEEEEEERYNRVTQQVS